VAAGRRGRGRSSHRHRGGNPSRRCDQPRADERGPARHGAGRRGPLLRDRTQRRQRDAGQPRAGQIRRRSGGDVPQPRTGRTGQATARRLAGAPRAGLQREQDARRPPPRGLLLLGLPRQAISQPQAADQTQQGGRHADPETARRRDVGPAWGQRRSGDQDPQPDHPGLVCLLPERGVQRGVCLAGLLRVATRLQVGQTRAREQVQRLDRAPLLRSVQPPPDGPVGVRRSRQPPVSDEVRVDEDRPPPAGQARGVPRRPGPDRLLGPATTQNSDPADRQDRLAPAGPPERNLSSLRVAAAARRPPAGQPTEWEHWLRTTRTAITRRAIVPTGPGMPDAPPARLLHAHCHRRLAAGTGSGPALLPARAP
jgi:hypothetical protein